MADPYFFGYGSLVNRDTHDYAPAFRARLRGWRRAWRHTFGRNTPFLTAVRSADSEIDGLVARVPGADWAALDERENGYQRHPITAGLVVENDGLPATRNDAARIDRVQIGAVQIYAVSPEAMISPENKPAIWMSYLDVVVQGYLREFGETGAHGFFATTDGWDTPVRDDRAKPRYSRHQQLSAAERAFVDDRLAERAVRILRD